MLRLVKTAIGPASIAAGSNGPSQVVEAYNAGDGALNLTVASSASWAVASVGAAGACNALDQLSVPCIPITVALNTSALSAGTQTAILTITGDANTVDAPQTVTVTVAMGGSIPSSINAYVPPGGSVDIPTPTNSNMYSKVTTQDGNNWLSMTYSGSGSFQFVYNWRVHIAPQAGNPVGTYNGSITFTGSSFAGDNKTVPVTMNVTTLPIAQDPGPLTFRLAQGAPPMTAPFSTITLNNLGMGTLTVTGVTPTIASGCGSSWLTVTQTTTGANLTLDPTGVAVGTCTATLAFATNAANTLAPVPVTMQVVPKGAPLINYQGVTDNVTFTAAGAVSPGDVVVIKGEQFSFTSGANGFAILSAIPWPTSLGGLGVSVNGETAPLYYTFYGQIAFQMPMDIAPGTALVTVTRSDGGTSNPASVPVAARAPAIDIITKADYTVPGATNPAHVGDTLILWAFGLGPTSPLVQSGQPAPSSPLPSLVSLPTVTFSAGNLIVPPAYSTPSYAGLAPAEAAIYQVNVMVPQGSPTGTVKVRLGFPDGTFSNAVAITVQ